jgi:predicted ArsR family transcriptional regulator
VAELSDTKRRVVERLKRVESATATDLANEFGLTDTAVRQHLEGLQSAGLVERSANRPSGRGRPPVYWQLTAAASSEFPDRHVDLTVELISLIRSALGGDALDRVLDVRADRQTKAYRGALAGAVTMAERLTRLAALRSDEGYMAEARTDGETMTLVEHHCPIRDAAAECGSVCSAELEVFRRTLGSTVTVTRTRHVLAGDRRCAYEIRPSR